MFSISADERDHITALTREFSPNNSFSSPESLKLGTDWEVLIAFCSLIRVQVLDLRVLSLGLVKGLLKEI